MPPPCCIVYRSVGWSGAPSLQRGLGIDGPSLGYGGTAKFAQYGKFADFGVEFASGDTITVFVDFREAVSRRSTLDTRQWPMLVLFAGDAPLQQL